MRPHRAAVLTFIALMAVTILNLVIPWIVKQVIDVGLVRGSTPTSSGRIPHRRHQRCGRSSPSASGMAWSVVSLSRSTCAMPCTITSTAQLHLSRTRRPASSCADGGGCQRRPAVPGRRPAGRMSLVIMLVIIIGILVSINLRLALLTLPPMPSWRSWSFRAGDAPRCAASSGVCAVSTVLRRT